jgi:hypothetical protein
MNRKIVSCVLLASLSLYIGCYASGTVTKEELKAKTDRIDMTVYTKDLSRYKFSKEDYRIHGDTLSGSGIRMWNTIDDTVRNASISFADIGLIESNELSVWKTVLLCGGLGLGAVVIIELLAPRSGHEIQVSPSFGSY